MNERIDAGDLEGLLDRGEGPAGTKIDCPERADRSGRREGASVVEGVSVSVEEVVDGA